MQVRHHKYAREVVLAYLLFLAEVAAKVPSIVVKFKQQVEQKRGAVVLQCFVVEEHFTNQAEIFASYPVVVSVEFKNADV